MRHIAFYLELEVDRKGGATKHMYTHMHMFMLIFSFLKENVVMADCLLQIFDYIIPHTTLFVKYRINILSNRINLYYFFYGLFQIAVDILYIQLAH